MATLLRTISVLVMVFLIKDVQVTALREYDMEYYCKDMISMILDDVHQLRLELDAEELTDGRNVRFPFACETVVEAWLSWPRLNVVLEETEIPCADGYLELFDGDSSTTISGLPSKICGTSSNLGTVTTTSMTLRVRFTALRRSQSDDAFSIVFTAFSQGQECYEHKCANGRCIHKDARCTGYDSCGDGSDCKGRGLSNAAIVGVVVGSLIGLGTLLAALVALCCCMKGKKSKRPQGMWSEQGGDSRRSSGQSYRTGALLAALVALCCCMKGKDSKRKRHKGRDLSGAALVGVVVGSLIGMGTLLVALVALCWSMKGKTSKRPQGGGEGRAVYVANPPPPAQPRQAPPTSYNHPAYGVTTNSATNQGVTNQGYATAQQPAFPAHFHCPVYNALEPTSPPEYSELYPEYTTPTASDQNKPPEASAQEKEETAPPAPETTDTVPPPGHDYTSVTTLQVRGINKDFEARGVNQGFVDISPPPETVEYDNVGVKQDG